MAESNIKKFNTGTVIFKEGDLEPFMYGITSGKVGIYAHYGKPDQKQLTVLSAEDACPYFGEMGLANRTMRSATAVALEDCTLTQITEATLYSYLTEHPEFIRTIIEFMSSRLRSLTNEYVDACHVLAEQEAAGKTAPRDSSLTQKINHYLEVFNQSQLVHF